MGRWRRDDGRRSGLGLGINEVFEGVSGGFRVMRGRGFEGLMRSGPTGGTGRCMVRGRVW